MRGRCLVTRAVIRQLEVGTAFGWRMVLSHTTEIQNKERIAKSRDHETKIHLKQRNSKGAIHLSMLSVCFIHFLKSYTH